MGSWLGLLQSKNHADCDAVALGDGRRRLAGIILLVNRWDSLRPQSAGVETVSALAGLTGTGRFTFRRGWRGDGENGLGKNQRIASGALSCWPFYLLNRSGSRALGIWCGHWTLYAWVGEATDPPSQSAGAVVIPLARKAADRRSSKSASMSRSILLCAPHL